MARTKEFDRDVVIDRAMELFWLRGYEATSLQDLVEHMGIGRGSLYATFGDKHRLYLAALDRYAERTSARMHALLERSESARAALEQIFGSIVDDAMSRPQRRGCLLTNTTVELVPHDPAMAEKVAASRAATEAAFRGALVRAQARGELAARHDPRALARFLVSSVVGLYVSAKAGAGRAELEDVVRVVLDALD